jgi:hypothetical protein
MGKHRMISVEKRCEVNLGDRQNYRGGASLRYSYNGNRVIKLKRKGDCGR